MEEKNNNKAEVKVNILGQEYVIKGDEPVDYIEDIAAFVNKHLQEVKEYNTSISKVRIMVLGLLNLADELYKIQDKQEKLETDHQELEKKYQNLLNEYQTVKEEYQKLQEDHQALLELVEEEE